MASLKLMDIYRFVHGKINGNELSAQEQSDLRSRQGVKISVVMEGLAVMDPETMTHVKKDGVEIGEIMIKGNCVMKGYLKNKEATDEAMSGGWFHSGDLAVMHPNGYIQIKDRSKGYNNYWW